jgi:hypothetical protein
MPFREKIFGVLVKIETTPLTDAAPVGTDAVRVVGIPTLKYDFLENGLRDDVVTGQLGAAERAIPAGRFGTIDLTLEVRGAGAAYSSSVAPEVDALLRMSGCGKTVTTTGGSESILYTTLDSGNETGTLYCYSANKLFKLVGCVATLKLSADATKRGMWTFTVTGKMVSDPTETTLPALTFSSVLPPLFHSSTATIGSWSSAAGADPLVLKSAGVDFGNTVTDRASAGATDGLAGYLVADRRVRQDMTVEVPLLTSFDIFAAAKQTGSSNPLSTWALGTVQYNRMKVQTGRWALEAPEIGAVNSINTAQLKGNLIIGAAPVSNREINFLFD